MEEPEDKERFQLKECAKNIHDPTNKQSPEGSATKSLIGTETNSDDIACADDPTDNSEHIQSGEDTTECAKDSTKDYVEVFSKTCAKLPSSVTRDNAGNPIISEDEDGKKICISAEGRTTGKLNTDCTDSSTHSEDKEINEDIQLKECAKNIHDPTNEQSPEGSATKSLIGTETNSDDIACADDPTDNSEHIQSGEDTTECAKDSTKEHVEVTSKTCAKSSSPVTRVVAGSPINLGDEGSKKICISAECRTMEEPKTDCTDSSTHSVNKENNKDIPENLQDLKDESVEKIIPSEDKVAELPISANFDQLTHSAKNQEVPETSLDGCRSSCASTTEYDESSTAVDTQNEEDPILTTDDLKNQVSERKCVLTEQLEAACKSVPHEKCVSELPITEGSDTPVNRDGSGDPEKCFLHERVELNKDNWVPEKEKIVPVPMLQCNSRSAGTENISGGADVEIPVDPKHIDHGSVYKLDPNTSVGETQGVGESEDSSNPFSPGRAVPKGDAGIVDEVHSDGEAVAPSKQESEDQADKPSVSLNKYSGGSDAHLIRNSNENISISSPMPSEKDVPDQKNIKVQQTVPSEDIGLVERCDNISDGDADTNTKGDHKQFENPKNDFGRSQSPEKSVEASMNPTINISDVRSFEVEERKKIKQSVISREFTEQESAVDKNNEPSSFPDNKIHSAVAENISERSVAESGPDHFGRLKKNECDLEKSDSFSEDKGEVEGKNISTLDKSITDKKGEASIQTEAVFTVKKSTIERETLHNSDDIHENLFLDTSHSEIISEEVTMNEESIDEKRSDCDSEGMNGGSSSDQICATHYSALGTKLKEADEATVNQHSTRTEQGDDEEMSGTNTSHLENECKEVSTLNENKAQHEINSLSPLKVTCSSTAVKETAGCNSPGFILSSPYTQTTEEYDALGHSSSNSQKNGEKTKKNYLEGEPNPKESDEKNSDDDDYGDSSQETKSSKTDKKKSPEKGNVFIGYSKRKKKFKCFLCDETGSGPSFEEHVMQHILWKPYKCLYCDRHQYFITRGDIGRHVAEVHEGKLPKCGLRAIKKAKEYMEYAQKDGTYQYFNDRLNDMYWSCKEKMTAEKTDKPLNIDPEEGQGKSSFEQSDIAAQDAEDKTQESSPSETADKLESNQMEFFKESGKDSSSNNDKSPNIDEVNPAELRESDVIQPRSQDFVTQLTKPEVSKLIALYHDDGSASTSNSEESSSQKLPEGDGQSREIPAEVTEVSQSPVTTPASTSAFLKNDVSQCNVDTAAVPVIINQQVTRSQTSAGITAVPKGITSQPQAASGRTILHVISPPPARSVQTLPQTQPAGQAHLSPQMVSQVLLPVSFAPSVAQPSLSPLFLQANSAQIDPTKVTVSLQPPSPVIIQSNSGNQQGMLAVPSVPQNVKTTGLTPLRMPLTVPSSNILTLMQNPPFLTNVPNVITVPPNTASRQGQNSGCKLMIVPQIPVNSVPNLKAPAVMTPQSQQITSKQGQASETWNISTSSSHPNSLIKSQKETTKTNAKQSAYSESAHNNKSPVILPQLQRISVGLIDNDFVCCACNGRYKHETSFRAHLWNHLHAERKPCITCRSSVNSAGRKTLSCDKTEQYIDRLKCNKIGNTAYTDIIITSAPAVHKQSDQGSSTQTLQPMHSSLNLPLPEQNSNGLTKITIQERNSSVMHRDLTDLPQNKNIDVTGIVTKESTFSKSCSGKPALFNNEVVASASGQQSAVDTLISSDLNQAVPVAQQKSTPVDISVSSSVSREQRPVDISTSSSVSREQRPVDISASSSVSREQRPTDTDTGLSLIREPCPVEKNIADNRKPNVDGACHVNREESSAGLKESTPVETGTSEASAAKRKSKWQFYVCGALCGYSTLYGSDLKKHVDECRFPNAFTCIHCHYLADCPDSLIRHMSKHYLAHGPAVAVHACFVNGCKFTTNILQGFCEHMVRTHPDLQSFECSNCKDTFQDFLSLCDHLQTNILHVVNCRHCSAKDLAKSVIISHMKLSHPDKPRMTNMVKQLVCKDKKENKAILKQKKKSPKAISHKLAEVDTQVNGVRDDGVDGNSALEIDRAASPALAGDTDGSGRLVISPTSAVSNLSDVTCPLSVDPVYECCVCSYVGENQNDLNTHMSKHAENPAVRTLAFSCPECPEEFNLLSNFESHLRKHANTLTYDVCSCLICKMKKGSRIDVEKHIKAMHNMVIGGGREFVDFKLKVSNSDVVKCKSCSFKCLGEENLRRHIDKHHAKGDSQNTKSLNVNCAETSQSLEQTRMKMFVPPSSVFVNAVRCIKCNFSSVYKGNLQRHINHFHPDVELVIEQGKVTSPCKVVAQPSFENVDENTLKIGGRLLDSELEWLYENHVTTFKCLFCSKDIQRKNNLHCHLLDHLEVSLWKCSLCDFRTSRRVIARDHVKDVHHMQSDEHVIIPLIDEIKTAIRKVLGKLVQSDKYIENIKPTLGTKELDDELKSKYKVIGKKKICKTCDAEHQSCYAIHSHIMRRHLKLFLFKCRYCTFEAVDRYTVSKHTRGNHPELELIVKYDPTIRKSKDKKDKHSKKRKSTSSEKVPKPDNAKDHLETPVVSENDDILPKPCSSSTQTVTSLSASVHSSSGKTLLPHESETRNELRVGSDNLDQKLRGLYNIKQARERTLVCSTCHSEHYSKYNLHCDLLTHLEVNLVACPYCSFESIENKQLTDHINNSHPQQKVYFLFLDVNVEDVVRKYLEKQNPKPQKGKRQMSPSKSPKISLSQLISGRKGLSPSKHLRSPDKLSKNVVSVTTGGLKKFKCRLCDYMALTKRSVGTHVFKVHENPDKTSSKPTAQKTPVPEKHTCKFCQFKSSVTEVLRNHYREKHSYEDSEDDIERSEKVGTVELKQCEAKCEVEDSKSNKSLTSKRSGQSPKRETENSLMASVKKPDIILERLSDADVVTDISESVKLKKRKEKDKKDDKKDEPPTKKVKVDPVTYLCPKCDFKNESKEEGVHHLQAEHGIKKLMQCDFCTASYVFEDKLKNHIKFLHKGKDVKYQLLPLESMLVESREDKAATAREPSGTSSSKHPSKSKASRTTTVHKDSVKGQKSRHSSGHSTSSEHEVKGKTSKDSVKGEKSKVLSRHATAFKDGLKGKSSKDSIKDETSEQAPSSEEEAKSKSNKDRHPSTSSKRSAKNKGKKADLSKTSLSSPSPKQDQSESLKCASEQVKLTPKPPSKHPSEDSHNTADKDLALSAKSETSVAKEAVQAQITRSKPSTASGNRKPKKSTSSKSKKLIVNLPPYVSSSPDNSDDEKGKYYKYLCVYCDFKANKRSEMKVHLANHSIQRLYNGKFPETEEARVKVRNKVRDIMPICMERAKNKPEQIVDSEPEEEKSEISPDIKPKEEKLSPKKRPVITDREPKCKQEGSSDNDSDSDGEILRPKKMRRAKRISSSEDESETEVKGRRIKKHLSSPSGDLTYCCHICTYKGKSLYKYRSHLASHGTFKYLDVDMSSESVLRCGFCGFLADDKEGFSQHVEKHLDGRIFKCGYCKYDTYHNKNMRSHLKNKHRHKPEKIIDLRQVLKERALRPTQRPQLVNLDPKLCLVNSLRNLEYSTLLDEFGCKTLDMPEALYDFFAGKYKIIDQYPDSSDGGDDTDDEDYEEEDSASDEDSALDKDSDSDDEIIYVH